MVGQQDTSQHLSRLMKVPKIGGVHLALSCRAGRRQLLRLDLYKGGSRLALKLMDQGLSTGVKTHFPAVVVDETQHRTKCNIQVTSENKRVLAAEILTWLLEALPPVRR